MGLRFKKSFKVAPGVKINVGKKSMGVSVGGKYGGISTNTKSGSHMRVSAPGTGLSYTTKLDSPHSAESSKHPNNAHYPVYSANYHLIAAIILFILGAIILVFGVIALITTVIFGVLLLLVDAVIIFVGIKEQKKYKQLKELTNSNAKHSNKE